VPEFNLIQRGELQERLVRGLVIKERSPAPSLEATVQAVVLLEDLTRQSPFIQPVEKRWSRGRSFAGVAAELSMYAIRNPAGSGIVTVVDSIIVSAGITQSFQVGRNGTATLGLLGSPLYIDRRNGVASAVQIFEGSDPLSQLTEGPMLQARVAVGAAWEMIPRSYSGILLSPGDTIMIESLSFNTAIEVSFGGRDYGI
jgi:hypothetical protein